MKNVWKKILATAMSAMMITATVQAATMTNHIVGGDKVSALTFYGNTESENVVGANGEKLTFVDAGEGSKLGGKAVMIENDATGGWIYDKIGYASESDYNGDNRIDISKYKKDGYFGMYIKVETDASSYPFWWNFWERSEENGWTTVSTETNTNGRMIDGTSYINKWAFVSIPMNDFCLNEKALLKHVYQSQMIFYETSVTAKVYVQGLGIYMPEITADTEGLSATINWTSVTGASSYNIKRTESGSLDVAKGLTATTFTDKLDKEGVYQYDVTAVDASGNEISTKTVFANVMSETLERMVNIYSNESGAPVQSFQIDTGVAPLGEYNIATSAEDARINVGTGAQIYDISNYWKDGYLGFYLRTQNAEDWKIMLCTPEWAKANYTVKGSDIGTGKWQFVKLKLSDYVEDNGTFDPSNLSAIVFKQPGKNGIRKIQGLGIYVPTSPSISVSSDVNGGNVTLSYSTKLANPVKYEIYRNGTLLSETTNTTYTDAPLQDAVHYYTVKALDAENKVICENEKIVGVLAADAEEIVSVYTNTNTAAYTNDSTYEQKSSPLGGYYVAKNADAAQTAIGLNNSDWSAAKGTDYITFYYYTAKQQQFILEIYTDGWKSSTVTVDAGNANINKWNLAKIKISDIEKSSEADFSKVIQIKLTGDEDFKSNTIAWQGIKIVSGLRNVTVTSMNIINNDTDDFPDYEANEELVITAAVENGTKSAITPALIAVCYDGTKLADCKIVNNTTEIKAGESGDITGNYTIPNITNPIVKIMVWDSVSGMKPYSQPFGSSK